MFMVVLAQFVHIAQNLLIFFYSISFHLNKKIVVLFKNNNCVVCCFYSKLIILYFNLKKKYITF